MFAKIIEWSIENKFLVLLATVFVIAAGVYALYLLAPRVHGPATLVLPLARNLLLASFLLSTFLGKGFFVSRLLTVAPLQYRGLTSYSLYLWQQLFVVALTAHHLGTLPSLGLTVLASLLSYRFVERPFLRLRPRFGLSHPLGTGAPSGPV